MLSKTTSSESPPVWTIVPPYSSIAGSIRLRRNVRSLSRVPASSKPNQTAVANHIRIKHGDQLSPIRDQARVPDTVVSPDKSGGDAVSTRDSYDLTALLLRDPAVRICTGYDQEGRQRGAGGRNLGIKQKSAG